MKTENWFQKLALRILGIIIGVGIVELISNLFDYGIYPPVTFYFGEKLWLSFTILFLLALILNYIMILAYDLLKKDIFGFEELKKLKDQIHDTGVRHSWFQRTVLKLEKKSRLLLLLFLCWYDPFTLTLYCRKNHQYNGFQRRDYLILFWGTALSCAMWSITWGPLGYYKTYIIELFWKALDFFQNLLGL